FHDHAPVAQVAQQVDHEKRISFSPGVKNGSEFLGKPVPRKSQCQVVIKIAQAQERQSNLAADATSLEFQLDRSKGMLRSQQVGGATSNQEQQPPRGAFAGEVEEQVNARWISPVNIVQENDQGALSCRFLEEDAEFALAAFLGSFLRLRKHLAQRSI